jgi:hypothetical protein
MAISTTIQENGTDKTLSVSKLVTKGQDSGTVAWVPEESTLVAEAYITHNGEYLASEHDLAGFFKVSVNVKGGDDPKDEDGNIDQPEPPSIGEDTYGPYDLPDTPTDWDMDPEYGDGTYIIGTGDDGNDWKISTDDGAITKTQVPSAIQIIRLPTKSSYEAGETIDYTGTQVKLLDGNGNDFTDENYPTGIPPFSELTFDPISAPMGGAYDTYTTESGLMIARYELSVHEVVDASDPSHVYNISLSDRAIGTKEVSGYGMCSVYASGIFTTQGFPPYTGSLYLTVYNGVIYAMADSRMQLNMSMLTAGGEDASGAYSSSFPDSGGFIMTAYQADDYGQLVPTSPVAPTNEGMDDLISLGFKATATWMNTYGGNNLSDDMKLTLVRQQEAGGGGGGGGAF